MNKYSSLKPTSDKDTFLWICEFCDTENKVILEEGEVPTTQCSQYIVSGSTNTKNKPRLAIFCIDISGSMCVSTEVQGKVNLHPRAKVHDLYNEFSSFTEGMAQWLPGQSQNVTYISRMQCVQSAVHRELENLAKNFPDYYPVLITFNQEVTTYAGTSNNDIRTISEELLFDSDTIYANAEGWNIFNGKVSSKVDPSVYEGMIDTVYNLMEGGGTALGPAIMYALGLASGAYGSKILVCTDGLANIGIGNLDGTGAELEGSSAIYSKMAEIAKKNGVSVSVISIRGEDCSMENLGKLSDATNGDVDILDPIELGTRSVNVLSIPVIATNVSITLNARKELKFVNGESQYIEEYGNVTAESDATFSFQPFNPIEDKNKILFQAQITFTLPDGSKHLRIYTKEQPITENRDISEQNLHSNIVGIHSLHESATLAQLGDYQQARINLISVQRLLQRGMKSKNDQKEYINFIKQAERLDGFMREAQHLDTVLKQTNQTRKQTRDDAAARNIVKMKKLTKSVFTDK
uniref:VWFA domain-containing protein n=1 Tax=Arcella intermedia TaxID=1963864 RepID=A0A6B2L0P9_9EUKA